MFIVGNLCGTCKIPLRIVCFPSETPLEKIKYSFVSGYQLQAACRSGTGQVSNSAFSSMASFDSEPCRLCACHLSCFQILGASILLPQRAFFSWCSPSPLCLTFFFFTGFLEYLGEVFDGESHLWMSVSRSLTVCILSLCICSHRLQEKSIF